jgi:hypothetical protein
MPFCKTTLFRRFQASMFEWCLPQTFKPFLKTLIFNYLKKITHWFDIWICVRNWYLAQISFMWYPAWILILQNWISKLWDLTIKISFGCHNLWYWHMLKMKSIVISKFDIWIFRIYIHLTLVSTYITECFIISCCFHVQIVKELNFTSMNMVLVVLHSTLATLSCVVVQPHS